ncbi:interferon gamma-like [Hemiscyllium ocellatum]|uniref:interferon gamma-like n=1 Tax=Hemiscyllium ocellatum TaxID=170820 RepID=UPI0029673D27|nr:interferon gamma-like [Hemiscyllium ocellatum]
MILFTCFIIGMVSHVLSDSAACAPPQLLDEQLTRLSQEFNINHPDVGNGGAIFTNMLMKYKQIPEKNVILEAVLRSYLDLFKVLKQQSEVKEHISIVANSLNECVTSAKYKMQNDLLNDLKKLSNIKWDDQMVQRKAILELREVLNVVKDTGKKRRKRNMGRRPRI